MAPPISRQDSAAQSCFAALHSNINDVRPLAKNVSNDAINFNVISGHSEIIFSANSIQYKSVVQVATCVYRGIFVLVCASDLTWKHSYITTNSKVAN